MKDKKAEVVDQVPVEFLKQQYRTFGDEQARRDVQKIYKKGAWNFFLTKATLDFVPPGFLLRPLRRVP